MKSHLENIAADQGWAFKYARPDYLAGDNGADTPNNMEAGTIALFCDPIETRPDLNNEGTRQGFRYIGRFMLLEKSEIDETYADKYDNYIAQMVQYLEVLERELACQGLELVVWRWEEIINEHWSNMDGVLVNFETRVWDTTPPEAVTSLSLTNENQEITLTDEMTPAVGTTDKPSRFFLMGNTEGLTLTTDSETQVTITGTPTVNTNAVLVARGKFGGFQVARLNITFAGSGDTVTVIDSGVYEEIVNCGETIELPDRTLTIKKDTVTVDTITHPAMENQEVEVANYVSLSTQFDVNDVDQGDIDNQQVTGINLEDDAANTVAPQSITQVGNKFIIEVTKPVFVLTQAEYDALTPDPNTYYLIDNG